jgi:hypothetical protein
VPTVLRDVRVTGGAIIVAVSCALGAGAGRVSDAALPLLTRTLCASCDAAAASVAPRRVLPLLLALTCPAGVPVPTCLCLSASAAVQLRERDPSSSEGHVRWSAAWTALRATVAALHSLVDAVARDVFTAVEGVPRARHCMLLLCVHMHAWPTCVCWWRWGKVGSCAPADCPRCGALPGAAGGAACTCANMEMMPSPATCTACFARVQLLRSLHRSGASAET